MKYIVIIQSAGRNDFREFLLKRRKTFNQTRIEKLECWIDTQPVYAVESWEEAIKKCRDWNRQKKYTVQFPHKVMFFDNPLSASGQLV